MTKAQAETARWYYEATKDQVVAVVLIGVAQAVATEQPDMSWWDVMAEARKRFEKEQAKITEMVASMRDSAFVITIVPDDKPDIKVCLETGAMVLLDKPLIAMVPQGHKISSNLKRCASHIIEMTGDTQKDQAKLKTAIDGVLRSDARARRHVKN